MSPAQMEAPQQSVQPIVVYAGFWKRFVAAVIDLILLGVVNTIISMVFFGGAIMSLGGRKIEQNDPAAGAAMLSGMALAWVVMIAVNWLYFAFMESSSSQATLGKMALGLRVTDLTGKRISFARATGRYFAKFVSGIILMIGYIMAGFTEKKQALHDMIASTLVLGKSPVVPGSVAANALREEQAV